MNHWPRMHTCVAAFVLIVLAAITIVGCSSSPAPGETTTVSNVPTSTTLPTSGSSSTSTPVTLSQYDRDLAKTATVQHDLSTYLVQQGAGDNDPRYGIVYGLRVRTQAITGRQALANNNTSLADTAMRDIRTTLNIGLQIATGTSAQILADAKATAAKIGAPSDAPDEAAKLLDQLISQLAPLLGQATATVSSTGTT